MGYFQGHCQPNAKKTAGKELAVQQVRSAFEIEYGSSIKEFLDSIYLAGADIGDSKLESYAKSIERNFSLKNKEQRLLQKD